MPELPEVETVKRGLEPVLTGSCLINLTLNRHNLRTDFPVDMRQRLVGQKIIMLRRRGKYLWIDLQSKETLVCHLGMSGSFTINPQQIVKHDHVIFETNTNDVIVYNDPRRFGMMFFVPSQMEHTHPAFQNMGVEPLGNDFHSDYLLDMLKTKSTAIKIALLDQNIIAGIGNIYACEALYEAGISPLRESHLITRVEAELLVAAIRNVLQQAISSGGSTLRDHRQVDGKMGYFQHEFKVYDREGEKCQKTGGKILRIIQAGRSSFYCPGLQK